MSSNRIRVLLVSLMAVFGALTMSAIGATSASAAECLLAANAGAGEFEAPSCTGVAGNKDYIKVSKLEKKLKEDEWCAKIEPVGAGEFEKNTCEGAAGTKEFAKVYTHGFWVCKEKAGAGTEPPVKYDDHTCSTKAKPLAERKWEWRPVRGTEVFTFTGTSGVSKLEGTLLGLRVLIECKKDTIKGEITAAGSTAGVVITYEECSLFEVKKYVKTAEASCTVPNIKTETLNDLLVTGKGIGPEDEFEPASGTTFAKVKIEGASCALVSDETVTEIGRASCRERV